MRNRAYTEQDLQVLITQATKRRCELEALETEILLQLKRQKSGTDQFIKFSECLDNE